MSTTPTRTIGGLGPAPAVSRLLKSNRTAEAPAPSPAEADEPTPAPPTAPEPDAAAPRARRATTGRQKPAQAPQAGKHTITVYVPSDLRQRARAAFNATRALEADASFSDMVTKAIEAEVIRREIEHNDGQRYAGGQEQLPTGRPLRD